MKDQSNSHCICAAFRVMLCSAVFSMACLTGLSNFATQRVLSSQASHSQSFVPAKKLAAAFERDILNARIHFIYFVTIQKPGTLEMGWGRYRDAESDLTALTALVNQQDELHPLSAPVARLRADIGAYDVALRATSQMVQNGEVKGPHYDAQVKEWTALGAVMVSDAGSVETLCAATSEASTDRMVNSVKLAQKWVLILFAAGFLLCLAVAWTLSRRIKQGLYPMPSERHTAAAEVIA
jgi:hypothetical protein